MTSEYYPLVSIIIPVYNGSNYLAESIDSALNQTYKNIEIIVINDGSQDSGATEKIALSYGNKIKYYTKPNGGVSTALNLGINKMRGDYFSWLSHDDKYNPEKIEHQIELLRNFNFDNHIVAYCLSRQINSESKYIKRFLHKNRLIPEKKYDGISIIAMMLRYGTFNGCAFLIPKSTFAVCGTFDESLRYNQDSVMWYNIFTKKYYLVCYDDVDVLSRVHNNQLTQTGKALFHSDCEKSSQLLIPVFKNCSTKVNNILYLYAKYNAKYKNPNIVKDCITTGNNAGILNTIQVFNLKMTEYYGNVRPFIRKIYHRIFNNVKTSGD